VYLLIRKWSLVWSGRKVGVVVLLLSHYRLKVWGFLVILKLAVWILVCYSLWKMESIPRKWKYFYSLPPKTENNITATKRINLMFSPMAIITRVHHRKSEASDYHACFASLTPRLQISALRPGILKFTRISSVPLDSRPTSNRITIASCTSCSINYLPIILPCDTVWPELLTEL
jgi:hypothetical protein